VADPSQRTKTDEVFGLFPSGALAHDTSGGLAHDRSPKKGLFFFEKKNQKTFPTLDLR